MQAGDDPQRRRLARPVRTDEPEDLAGFDVQRQLRERGPLPEALG